MGDDDDSAKAGDPLAEVGGCVWSSLSKFDQARGCRMKAVWPRSIAVSKLE